MKNNPTPVKKAVEFVWKDGSGQDVNCVVVNDNMAEVYLCMRAGTTSGVFSVRRSEIDQPQVESHPDLFTLRNKTN